MAEKFHPDLPAEFFSEDRDEALALAEALLERECWEQARLAQIEDQPIANKLFDMAVTMGVHQAVLYAQRAANAALQTAGAQPIAASCPDENGTAGAETVTLINAMASERYLDLLREFSAAHYHHIAGVNPAQAPNLQSWLLRAGA